MSDDEVDINDPRVIQRAKEIQAESSDKDITGMEVGTVECPVCGNSFEIRTAGAENVCPNCMEWSVNVGEFESLTKWIKRKVLEIVK